MYVFKWACLFARNLIHENYLSNGPVWNWNTYECIDGMGLFVCMKLEYI